MPPDPPRVKGLSGLWKIYPSVILNYPLVQKFIETPVHTLLYICIKGWEQQGWESQGWIQDI